MTVLLHKGLPVHSFKNAKELHGWFSQNHTQKTAFWIRYYKKDSNKPTIVHSEAVDEALCWGWIDGLANRYDEESWLVRFTPRRPKSVWSKINVAKVERLTAEGRMNPEGQQHVDRAKSDGRWEAAYGGQATIPLPDEFISLLKTDPQTWEFYQSLNKANKYAIAHRIATAVGEEKKRLRMQKLFATLQARKTFH